MSLLKDLTEMMCGDFNLDIEDKVCSGGFDSERLNTEHLNIKRFEVWSSNCTVFKCLVDMYMV